MLKNKQNNISNLELSKKLKLNYSIWKDQSLKTENFFVIFNKFSNEKLKNISGNALKLYIYLGINSNTRTGEVWHSNKTIADYFNKSERTIRLWMKELERLNLIYRIQLKFNEESHTYLQPYIFQSYIKTEKYIYAFRFKKLEFRELIPLTLFEYKISMLAKKYFKIKIYISIKKDSIQITTFNIIKQIDLDKFPHYLNQNLKEELIIYMDAINQKNVNEKDLIFENYKYTNRYYNDNNDELY